MRRYFSLAFIVGMLAGWLVLGRLEAQQPVTITGTVSVGNLGTTDGGAHAPGSTPTVAAGFRRDNGAHDIGGSCNAEDDICTAAINPNGHQIMALADYSSGSGITLATDPLHDNPATTSGPQGMHAFRADIDATANVSDGDAVRSLADGMGRGLIGPPCPGGNIIDDQQTDTDGSSTAFSGGFAAGGSNVVLEVWEIALANSSATFVTVDIRDGAAGAVLATYPVPAGGGAVLALNVPIRSTANTALAADPSAGASTVTIALRGCTAR